MMDEHVASPDAGEQVSVTRRRTRNGTGVRGTHGSSFRSGRSRRGDLREVGEIEQALDAVDLLLAGAEPDA